MDLELSPFTPNQPVSAEFFVGRNEHIESLRSMVRRARRGNLQVGWISGERGIGKSSLASLIASLAEREENAIVAHIHLGGVRKLTDLARETHTQILRDNPETKAWGINLWNLLSSRVEKIGAFGIELKLKMSEDELSGTIRSFTDTLEAIVKAAGGNREMMLLVFDDINGLANNPDFANWLKSMVDGEATSGRKNPICLIFAGLEDRFQRMKKHNPSVGRIFMPWIDIQPWTQPESMKFFQSAFKNRGCYVKSSDIKLLASYSDGLPVMAHEIGNSVWKFAKSKKITSNEILDGIFDAAESIGRNLGKDIIQALQSKNYRSILRKITGPDAQSIGFEFSRKQLHSMENLTNSEKKGLDNFVTRMRKLGALVPGAEGERGSYRFATRLHRIYFFIEALRAKNN